MLRLLDARLDDLADVRPAPGRLLRVQVSGPAADSAFHAVDLRVLLVADVLLRVAELESLQVVSVQVAACLPDWQAAAVADATAALNIHPLSARVLPEQAEGFLGGPPHVCVAADDLDPGGHCVLVRVGPVHDVRQDAGQGHDPLAARLALMATPYRDAAEFSDAALASAESLLSRWRNRVAEWAEAPSRPMPAGTGDAVRAAVEDDLDTVAALAILRSVEANDSIPAGAKFETFAYADRLLGLDIASDVGHRRS